MNRLRGARDRCARTVPGSVHEGMLKDAGNCACDVWPLATHQRRSSLTSSLAEANGKHCNARLLREFQAPLLRNVWFMGYVSFLRQCRPTCVDIKIPPREKCSALNIVIMFCVACRRCSSRFLGLPLSNTAAGAFGDLLASLCDLLCTSNGMS